MTWLGEGQRKFGIHFIGWFAAVSLLLVLVNLSGAPFAWPWVLSLFLLILSNLLWTEWQEYRLGAQDGAKTVWDLLAKIWGSVLACLGAGVWWWV
jgi:hypothetical protein